LQNTPKHHKDRNQLQKYHLSSLPLPRCLVASLLLLKYILHRFLLPLNHRPISNRNLNASRLASFRARTMVHLQLLRFRTYLHHQNLHHCRTSQSTKHREDCPETFSHICPEMHLQTRVAPTTRHPTRTTVGELTGMRQTRSEMQSSVLHSHGLAQYASPIEFTEGEAHPQLVQAAPQMKMHCSPQVTPGAWPGAIEMQTGNGAAY